MVTYTLLECTFRLYLPVTYVVHTHTYFTTQQFGYFSFSGAQHLEWQDLLLLSIPGNRFRVNNA